MKLFLITSLLLISTNLVFAQNIGQNWEDITQLNSQKNSEIPVLVLQDVPTTTTFSVEIPNEEVALTIAALCYSTDINFNMDNCTGDVAKKVVIQWMNEKVSQYADSLNKKKTVNIQ